MILLVIAVQLDPVQNFIKDKAVVYLHHKLRTRVSIGHISILYPKNIRIQNIFLSDQQGHTLLACQLLEVNLNLPALLHSSVEVRSVHMRGLNTEISRNLPGGGFNFNFITKAFSSPSKAPVKQDTSSLHISLGDIDLEKIHFSFQDTVTGYHAVAGFEALHTHIDRFDLKQMKFGIPRLMLSGLNASIRQEKPAASAIVNLPAKEAVDPSPGIVLDFGSILLDHDKAGFKSKELSLGIQLVLTKLQLGAGMLDLGKQVFRLQKVELLNTQAKISFLKTLVKKDSSALVITRKTGQRIVKKIKKNADSAALAKQPAGKASTGWKVDIGTVNLDKDAFRMDNENSVPLKQGLDYAHLNLTGLHLNTGNIHYEPAFTKVQLNELALKDQSGFSMEHASGAIYFDDHRTEALKLKVQTGESRLDASVKLGYSSLASLSSHIGELKLEVGVAKSILGLKEVLYFVPSLRNTEPFKKGELRKVNFEGNLSGSVNKLHINGFEASALSQTHLKVRGDIRGLPDAASLYLDLYLDDLSTGKNDLNQVLSKGMIPASVKIPERLKISSRMLGSLKDLQFRASLSSSLGNAETDGRLGINHRDTSYLINLKATGLQAGKLSGQDSILGPAGFMISLKGQGLSLASAHAAFQGRVQYARIKEYTYKDLNLQGTIDRKQLQLQASMPDRNLSFRLNASADLRGKAPALKVKLQLDSADFKALKLTSTTARAHGLLSADIPSLNLQHPEGILRLSHVLLVQDSSSIPLDSLSLTAHTQGINKQFRLESEFLKAHLEGQISLADITDQLKAQLNSYYQFSPGKKEKKFPEENFSFGILVLGPPAVHKLIPKLASFSPLSLSGSYASVKETLNLNISAPHTQYTDIHVDSLRLLMQGRGKRLNYSLLVDSATGAGFDIETTSLSGYAEAGNLHLGLTIKDDAKKDKYQLAALLNEHNGSYDLKLNPDSLLLNYQNWVVAADNELRFGKSGIQAHDLNLSNDGSSIKVNSSSNTPNSPLKVEFIHFDLANVSRFLEKDSVLIRGQLDGGLVVDNLITKPVFTSDLTLNDFSYKKDTLGTIHLKVDNKTANTFTAAAEVNGKGNSLTLLGEYDTGNSSFNADLNLSQLNLASVQVYAMNQISHSRGFINGRLHASGTVAAPLITGNLGFRGAGFTITYLNSDFRLPDQQILFNGSGIHFNDFLLLDSAKNTLDLDGDVLTTNYRDYKFDLNLSSEDFRIINSGPSENALFYGKVYLNSDIDITGDLNKPKINADITLNNKTRFTYLIPADDPSLQENNGIVEFVNSRDSMIRGPVKKARNNAFKGLDFSANLNVQKDAEFTVVIDPQTGDALKVKGQATLNTTIDPSGKISLTGRYEIDEGSYQLSLNNFIKKSFSIQKGSTITWTGEPTSATVNITAVYQASAPSIDLMDQQTDASTSAKYKQKLPFQLNLMMNGELLKPAITFAITLPEKERNLNPDVQAQLDVIRQDPSELNKQVFALLVLGRFVGQNPFQSASGGGMDAGLIARQSAGKIMGQQLNKIAGNLIKGVDLNFDLNSQNNYTSGEKNTQTDLKIGATKTFNDRLAVSVGSDIALEGSQSQASTSTLIGDVSVEYKVSRDGRYRLRAFRRNATQEYVQGQFIETGVSFIFVLDYDAFKEIFKGVKQEKYIKPSKP